MKEIRRLACNHCGTLFNTWQGHGTHQRTCARKRSWEREHYLAHGAWPKRGKPKGIYAGTNKGSGHSVSQGILASRMGHSDGGAPPR